MMNSILNILSLCCLLGITYQDFKERKVYLWLLIITGSTLTLLFFSSTYFKIYLINIGINAIAIVFLILMLLWYTKYKLKTPFKEAFGLGDLLFFICIAISFPTATFIVLFTFSLFFAALVFLLTKHLLHEKSIPLAGLQASFLFLIIGLNWSINFVNLYML